MSRTIIKDEKEGPVKGGQKNGRKRKGHTHEKQSAD